MFAARRRARAAAAGGGAPGARRARWRARRAAPGDRVLRARVRLLARRPRRERCCRREQTESHRLIEFLMIAANEAVAGLLESRKLPALYRVHEPPDPARVERLLAQLASLGRADAAGARAPDRRSRRASWSRRRRTPSHGPGVHVAGPAVAQAGALLAAQPRPLRAALAALLPLHVADPPLPGPDLPPRAAVGDRRRRGDRRAPPTSSAAAEWCSARERDAMSIERAADNVARAFLLEQELFRGKAGFQREFSGEVVGRDRRGRVRGLRRLRGPAARAPAARRLVGAQRARDDADRHRAPASGIRLGDPVHRAGREDRRAARARRPQVARA